MLKTAGFSGFLVLWLPATQYGVPSKIIRPSDPVTPGVSLTGAQRISLLVPGGHHDSSTQLLAKAFKSFSSISEPTLNVIDQRPDLLLA